MHHQWQQYLILQETDGISVVKVRKTITLFYLFPVSPTRYAFRILEGAVVAIGYLLLPKSVHHIQAIKYVTKS